MKNRLRDLGIEGFRNLGIQKMRAARYAFSDLCLMFRA
jgi:hypothetical protein